MRLRGFQSRIMLLMISVVLVAQLATIAVVHYATARGVVSDLSGDIEAGQRVWQRMNRRYALQQLERARMLADDAGFRRAAARDDPAAMEAELLEHARLVDAGLAMLLAPDGDWRTGTLPIPREEQAAVVGPLLEEAGRNGYAVEVIVLQGRLYRVALVPVHAPGLVGWVGTGKRISDTLAKDFRDLTGLDIILSGAGDRPVIYGTSLAGTPRDRLASALGAVLTNGQHVEQVRLGGAHYLAMSDALAADRGSTRLRAVVMGSLDQGMAPFRQLKEQILLLSALAGLAAVAVAGVLARSLGRPVGQLVSATRRIREGDYSQPVGVATGGELGELAGSIDRLQLEIEDREGRLLHQAYHDALTGLPNRASSRRWLETALARAPASGRYGVLMLIDLDRFNELNDAFGHEFADTVLVEVGRRLVSGVGEGDHVARMGSDEFLVLACDLERDTAMAHAQRLLLHLRQPLDLSLASVTIDASIGLAVFPDDGVETRTLLRRADIALHEARAQHTGVAAYQAGHDELHQRQVRLMGDLRGAAERNEIYLRFQPQVSLIDGSVEHVEALLRWEHPTLGNIPPDEFIGLAEHSGAIHGLVRAVLALASASAARWRALGLDLGLSINLSTLNLLDAQLPEDVERCLHAHGIPPDRVVLEVTESAVMDDVEYAIRMLQQLHECGVRLSIDDFGTGYSSLAQLKRMPVDELKIDKGFVTHLVDGSDDAVIVRSTIELGHNMGLSIVAEGVENAEAEALLRALGCDMAQGYHYARPLSEDELVAWCQRRRCRRLDGVLHRAGAG